MTRLRARGVWAWRFAAGLAAILAVSGTARAQATDSLQHQGVERQFILYRAAGATGPVPLVVALHGLTQSVEHLRQSWTMDAVADREGFAVLYPLALNGRWSYSEGRSVMLPDGKGRVDDAGFILALLDMLIKGADVDAARVFATGTSNGGLMAWTLACQAAERFAAVAPMNSGMTEEQRDGCRPARLVPLLIIAGTADWVQAYDGGLGPGFRLLSIPETLEHWRRLRNCEGYSATQVGRREQGDPTRAVMVRWKDCRDASALRFLRIEGGGHYLPSFAPWQSDQERQRHGGRSRAVETAEEVWAFFREVVR